MKNYICVYDFETDDSDEKTCEPIQLASVIINEITLEIVPGSEFSSYMRPWDAEQKDFDRDQYFESHYETLRWHAGNYQKTADELLDIWLGAPSQRQVIDNFKSYLVKWNKNQKSRNKFGAPIRGGHNIVNFDNVIFQRLCERFGLLNDRGEQKMFAPRDNVDILQLAFYWFENLPEPVSYNMDELRRFFGIEKEGGHDALKDVRDEAIIIQKFMRLHRSLAPKISFQGSVQNETNNDERKS